MVHMTHTGGVSFSSSSLSGTLEGNYIKTDTGYLQAEDLTLFVAGSCDRFNPLGLWLRLPSGKSKYLSRLKSHHTKTDTYIFDLLSEEGSKDYFLLILKEDRARIVRTGGTHDLF